MIPLTIPNLRGNEKKYLKQCIDSNFVSYVGPFVTRLETMTARAAGAPFGVATSSGTTGLHLALVSVGVKKGDRVIVPSLTFIASANAVKHCGAEPIFLDVSPDSWTLDPIELERFLSAHDAKRYRIAAIMPVYTLGLPADMDRIRRIAARFRIPIVADAAPALGATYKGKPIGNLADLTVFSFNGNKTVTAGGGGMIVGCDEKLTRRAKHLSTTARLSGLEYRHDEVGYNYRMTNVQAAVGCAQLEKLSALVATKRRIGLKYDRAFARLKGVSLFPTPPWAKSARWISGIVIQDPSLPDVMTLCVTLKKEGIEAKPFWKPVHLQAPYRRALRTPLPLSNALWKKILTLPSSTQLTEKEQNCVIRVLKKLLSKGECQ